MARTVRTTTASPEAVWAVLADAGLYADWVVGAREVRDASVTWPAVDSVLHHTVGIGPLQLRDRTRVLYREPPRQLVLTARGRPFGQARIDVRLHPSGDGTEISIDEVPSEGLGRLVHSPVVDLTIHLRNKETLRRLARLAESAP